MEELAAKIKKALGKIDSSVEIWRERRLEVHVDVKDLLDAAEVMLSAEIGFRFLCTIVGMDTGEGLEVKYILGDKADVLALTVDVPYDRPRVPTLTGLFPAAILYEREVHDMVGVKFWGHPNLAPLVLSEDWPEGMYPLRKDFQFYKDDEGKPVKGCLLEKVEELKEQIDPKQDNKKNSDKESK